MRFIFAAAAAIALTACGQAGTPETEITAITAPAEDTRVLAVMSYADWCGSCKALDPKVEAVQTANTFDGVEFVKLNYTERDADAFFADADTAGVGPAMRTQFADKIKTGRMYLVDLGSGEIVGTVDKSMDEAAITQAIMEAAALS
ncbi:MAG: thioredoxin family protein [Pseudomonadota bacterium]